MAERTELASQRKASLAQPFDPHLREVVRHEQTQAGVAQSSKRAYESDGLRFTSFCVFHDLRDTGLTHMAVRGDSHVIIQWAGGHTNFKTTQGYIERGQTERRRIGDPLPPLPPSLLKSRSSGFARVSQNCETDSLTIQESNAILRPQRELNPCYRRERPVS
jgi:hypothetical protein